MFKFRSGTHVLNEKLGRYRWRKGKTECVLIIVVEEHSWYFYVYCKSIRGCVGCEGVRVRVWDVRVYSVPVL